MTVPEIYSFPRYLAAKKSVDDRALHRGVWQSLQAALPPSEPEHPLRVVEAGAGAGAMLERMLERGLIDYAHYTAVDQQAGNTAAARLQLPVWAREQGYGAAVLPGGLVLARPGSRVEVRLETEDVFEFAARQSRSPLWDLLVAHAFLDLVDIPAALPRLFSLLKQGGFFYFSVNFDGLTLLEPVIDPVFDEQVLAWYHRTMDERQVSGRPSGDSQAGRHLFAHLLAAGAQVLDAGASDWVVFSGRRGYPADEAYFLHFILHTLHTALQGCSDLDPKRFERWIQQRHAQVERGELVYIAHQLDYVGTI